MEKAEIILGVDPGTMVMGFGVLKVHANKTQVLEYGVLHLRKYTSAEAKLEKIFDCITRLILTHKPNVLAIEAPFFGKNVQSMLKLGRAQGIAIAAALAQKVPFVEYAPRKVKLSITGKGTASKEQVAAMLQKLLNLQEESPYFDATDALGVALCHSFQKKDKPAKGYSGWSAFLKDNPGRKM